MMVYMKTPNMLLRFLNIKVAVDNCCDCLCTNAQRDETT